MDDTTVAVLYTIAPRLPLLIVYVVGIILAIVYASALRGAAPFAGWGFTFLLGALLVGFAGQYFVMTAAREGLSPVTVGMSVAAYSWASTGASVIGTVLLMVAIYARRKAPPRDTAE